MRGVSEVIAIILILMITISLAGLAYMFMSPTMSDVTSSAASTVDMTTSSMLTSFTIESIDIAKVYVRNTGQSALTSLSVYVNDEPAIYNVTPSSISAGTVGTITIYSFIPDGSTVKVTSSSGFSTSKIARPCEKASACWKFDEGAGTTVFDSSPNGNNGNIIGNPSRISGKNEGGLMLDGVDDYVNITERAPLSLSQFSYGAWFKANVISDWAGILTRVDNIDYKGYNLQIGSQQRIACFTEGIYTISNSAPQAGIWYYAMCVYNGTHVKLYVNGVLQNNINQKTITHSSGKNLKIGLFYTTVSLPFNGTIDEVRIYDRAIY